MSQILSFNFSTKDPEFKTWAVDVTNPVPNNLITHAFISTPIYDDFGVKIGYKVSDDYIQQVSENKYMIRISNTYYIQNKGTISWNYSFLNDKPSYFYPIGVVAKSNIVSTTGEYFGRTGAVFLEPLENGLRKVQVIFNF